MSGIDRCYVYYSSTCRVLTGAMYYYSSTCRVLTGAMYYYSSTCLVFTGAMYIIVLRVGYLQVLCIL